MEKEEVVAQKDKGNFFNYSILMHSNKNVNNCDLALLVSLVRTTVLQDVFDYETGKSTYEYGSSDEWFVRYGELQTNDNFYIEFYDFWAEQEATKMLDGASCLMLPKIKSLKIITRDNLLNIINSWKIIYKHKPEYVVIEKDNSGWINLESKGELSEQDLKEIEQKKL